MRVVAASCLLGLLVLVSGCGFDHVTNVSRGPLFAGRLEGGTFWKNPMTAASNEGGDYAKGSRVEIYDQFVIVTTQDGLSHIHPHGYYSGLVIKRD